MSDSSDKCQALHCRNEAAINYLGARVCNRCWEGLCEYDNDLQSAGMRHRQRMIELSKGFNEKGRKAIEETL